MTKSGLIQDVAQRTPHISKRDTEVVVNTIFDAMVDALKRGDRIEIRGFGVFQVKDTRPKPAARNPRTGEIIYVPARRKTHFKPGRLLKEALHQTREEGGVVPPAAGSPPADTASGVASAYSATDRDDDDDDY